MSSDLSVRKQNSSSLNDLKLEELILLRSIETYILSLMAFVAQAVSDKGFIMQTTNTKHEFMMEAFL